MNARTLLTKLFPASPDATVLMLGHNGNWQAVTDVTFSTVPGQEIYPPTTVLIHGTEYVSRELVEKTLHEVIDMVTNQRGPFAGSRIAAPLQKLLWDMSKPEQR